ncbi:MAG: hypothetical protein JO015_13775 [Verrucomicrobia bacterium]|nr:hypothetical protein [Verrucomicrobiota bacterium]
MPNRPPSRDDQAWEIFLVLLGHKPYSSLHQLVDEAYNAAEAFENYRTEQEPYRQPVTKRARVKAPPAL